jgi:hypothetical protein
MQKINRLLAALAISLLVPGAVIAQTSSFKFGDQTVIIPSPEGFEEAVSQFASVRDGMTRTEAAGNVLLAVHLPHADCEDLRAGKLPAFTFYTKISAPSELRETDYSAERFAQLITSSSEKEKSGFDLTSPGMRDVIGKVNSVLKEGAPDTRLEVGKPVMLGEIDKRPNVYGVMILLPISVSAGDVSKKGFLIGGMTLLRVHQRLIYVYTYREYKSEADLTQLQDFTKNWLTQILAANQ